MSADEEGEKKGKKVALIHFPPVRFSFCRFVSIDFPQCTNNNPQVCSTRYLPYPRFTTSLLHTLTPKSMFFCIVRFQFFGMPKKELEVLDKQRYQPVPVHDMRLTIG